MSQVTIPIKRIATPTAMSTTPKRIPNDMIVTPRPMIGGDRLGGGRCGSGSAVVVVSWCPDTGVSLGGRLARVETTP